MKTNVMIGQMVRKTNVVRTSVIRTNVSQCKNGRFKAFRGIL